MAQKAKESVSWETSDTQEIERRQKRAQEETMLVKPVEKGATTPFQDYFVLRTGIQNALTTAWNCVPDKNNQYLHLRIFRKFSGHLQAY